MAAQALVKKGKRWQVGNGHSIMIWKDKWLLSPSTYEVVSPISNMPGDSRVAALIDEEKGAWKNVLVCNVFLPHEADIICGIALSANLPVDKQVWASTTNGLFSARSAYKLAMEMRLAASMGKWLIRATLGGSGGTYGAAIFHIRSVTLLGRLAELCCQRIVILDSCCDECKMEEESLGHLFWCC